MSGNCSSCNRLYIGDQPWLAVTGCGNDHIAETRLCSDCIGNNKMRCTQCGSKLIDFAVRENDTGKKWYSTWNGAIVF